MSERTKNVLLAKYIILKNSGARISENMKKAIERIEAERMAVKVARV